MPQLPLPTVIPVISGESQSHAPPIPDDNLPSSQTDLPPPSSCSSLQSLEAPSMPAGDPATAHEHFAANEFTELPWDDAAAVMKEKAESKEKAKQERKAVKAAAKAAKPAATPKLQKTAKQRAPSSISSASTASASPVFSPPPPSALASTPSTSRSRSASTVPSTSRKRSSLALDETPSKDPPVQRPRRGGTNVSYEGYDPSPAPPPKKSKRKGKSKGKLDEDEDDYGDIGGDYA